MNEFLEQFLAECRELVEQATADLLALEERPDERERIDSVFRGFHTLKGAAGIMEFDPMVRALHAAEDVLSAVRSAAAGVSALVVGDCLAALDQVSQWLDHVEADEQLPPDAAQVADALVRRFGQAAITTPAVETATTQGWEAALLARHPDAALEARYALRYAPGPQAFFDGIDPLEDIQALDGLLALDIRAAGDLPALDSLDPYACLIVFEALLAGPAGPEIEALRRPSAGVELIPLASSPDNDALGLPPASAALIQAQIAMLEASGEEGRTGRAGSAARVAMNVLGHAGLRAEAETLAGFTTDDTAALARVLRQLMAGELGPTAQEQIAQTRSTPDALVRSLRVDVARVDALVNLTGELLVAKNALGHAVRLSERGGDVGELARTLRLQHAQLDRLTAELQHSVLDMRVLPMRQVFQRFPRVVREMVAALGKPTRLVTHGDATEADKTIVEGLFEPLLHVLRNAMDHGVESAAERAAAGKPPSATITLRAYRSADRVVIEVEDDGRGLDLERIRAVAAERGVAEAAALKDMSDAQIADLVFAPGFSTARQVGKLSGRGVGMDAVRTAVERMGGQASLQSRAGQATLVRLSLPFTMVMTRVLTVEAAGQMFGIPLDAVLETIRLRAQDVRPIGSARAFVLRDRTVPLIGLGEVLDGAAPAAPQAEVLVVVAQAAGQIAGLAVDRLGERIDVMLKPMDGLLAHLPEIMGTTLLGDGRVLLILDLQELLA